MTEMQKQFEEWAKKAGHKMGRAPDDPHFYDWASTACAWKAWQASRAAIVVSLPETHSNWLDKQIVQHALQKEGIKYE